MAKQPATACGPDIGFINFLRQRQELGGQLTLVKELGRLYVRDQHPNGMIFRWYYDRHADAEYIAKQAGIPLER